MSTLIDMQNQEDDRHLDIDQVGISGLRYPIRVLDRSNQSQHTVAEMSMSVGLPHQFKGTHMSRFIEIIESYEGDLTLNTFPNVLDLIKDRLQAHSAQMKVKFPYFLKRSAPVSKATALMDYECWFEGESTQDQNRFVLGVSVPVTSLCPCSKAISDYGAHNQRGYITMEVESGLDEAGYPYPLWIEDLVELAEQSASAPVYPLLKRDDERYVTMQAYDHPAFVEDIVRNVALRLKTIQKVSRFRVHVVNHESIHNHGAFAEIRWSRS